jgi:hypothetical protein
MVMCKEPEIRAPWNGFLVPELEETNTELLTARHKTGHLDFSEFNLLPTPIC